MKCGRPVITAKRFSRSSTSPTKGKPGAVFGHSLVGYLLYFHFLGTDEVTENIKLFTRFARQYINEISDQHFEYRPVVAVWEDHHQSRAWLRLLGFEDTGAVLWQSENRFHLVERR